MKENTPAADLGANATATTQQLREETMETTTGITETRRDSGSEGDSYWARHHRGEFSLARSWWINGVLVALAGNILLFAFVLPLLAAGFPDLPTAISYVAQSAFVAVVWTWSAVGTWRSAGQYKGPRIWATLARTVLVIGALYEISIVVFGLFAAAQQLRQWSAS